MQMVIWKVMTIKTQEYWWYQGHWGAPRGVGMIKGCWRAWGVGGVRVYWGWQGV